MIKTIPRSAQTSASTVFGVRVTCGHLCEAEAPTEAAAETVACEAMTEGLLQTEIYIYIETLLCVSNL